MKTIQQGEEDMDSLPAGFVSRQLAVPADAGSLKKAT